MEGSFDLRRLSERYEGEYGRGLRDVYGWLIMVEAVAGYLNVGIDVVLFGVRYGRFLDVLALLTAKANAEAERVVKMEREAKKQDN